MNRKYLFLVVALSLIIALPIVAAALTQSQTIHIKGTAHNNDAYTDPDALRQRTNSKIFDVFS